MGNRGMVSSAIIMGSTCFFVLPANAQALANDAPAQPAVSSSGEDGSGLTDIIVTATRRSESLQKVPVTVSAVSSGALAMVGAVNVSNIQSLVPGLVIQRTANGVNPYLRGVGAVSGGFSTEQPIATYLDGVYMPYAASGMFAFNNIERIEVLKGPQGTLFGRNSAGGLIQVVTRDPSQAPHVEGSLSYGNFDTIDGALYATTGVTDTLAIDLAVLLHDQRDGWGTNVSTGTDIFKGRQTSVTSKLKWTPTERTTVSIRGLYDKNRTSIGAGFGVFPGSFGTDGTPFLGKYTIANRIDPLVRNEQQNYSVRVEQDLDFATLISISAYSHIDGRTASVLNGIPGNLVTGQGASQYTSRGIGKTFTQELQLVSPKSSPISWIGGAFFMRDHLVFENFSFPTCIDAACNGSPVPALTHADQLLTSYAVFGEVTVPVAEGTRITAGLRYTKDTKDVSDSFRGPLPGYSTSVATLPPPLRPGDPGGNDPKTSFSRVTWRGVLSHDLTRSSTAYVSANRGFKAGSYNLTVFSNPVVRPEVLDAYEIGVKNELFDRRLRLNVAAFYYDYKDLQVRSNAPPAPPGFGILQNAAKSRIKGLDVDFEFAPDRNLTISGGMEILDAKFRSFPGASCSTARVIGGTVLGGTASTTCDLAGARMPRAPKFTGNIGINYRLPTDIGEFQVDVRDSYNSGFFWEADNRLRQDSYHLVNLTFGWRALNRKFGLQLYAHNLTKTYYFSYAANTGVDTFGPAEPRTYGVKADFSF